MEINGSKLLDILTIAGFVVGLYALQIGLENLQENRLQSEQQNNLLIYLEEHLRNQDEHLKKNKMNF